MVKHCFGCDTHWESTQEESPFGLRENCPLCQSDDTGGCDGREACKPQSIRRAEIANEIWKGLIGR